MASIKWRLNGQDVNPRKIKVEVLNAAENNVIAAASAVAKDLQELLDRLEANSSNRGVGFLAVRYNNPFDGARVEVDNPKPGVYRVGVPSEGKGSGGYRFNLLDQGTPAKSSVDEVMTFPVTKGSSTKPGSLEVTPVEVDPTRWVAIAPGESVRGAAARNFLITINKERKDDNREIVAPLQAKITPWKFRINPKEIKSRVVRS